MTKQTRWVGLGDAEEDPARSAVSIRIDSASFHKDFWCCRLCVRNPWVMVTGWAFLADPVELRFEARRDQGELAQVWDGLTERRWEDDTLSLVALTSGLPLAGLKEGIEDLLRQCRFEDPVERDLDGMAVTEARSFTCRGTRYPIPAKPKKLPPVAVHRWAKVLEGERRGAMVVLHAMEGGPKELCFSLVHREGAGCTTRVSPFLFTIDEVLRVLDEANWGRFNVRWTHQKIGRLIQQADLDRALCDDSPVEPTLPETGCSVWSPDDHPDNANWIQILNARRIAETVPGARELWEQALREAGRVYESAAVPVFLEKLRVAGIEPD